MGILMHLIKIIVMKCQQACLSKSCATRIAAAIIDGDYPEGAMCLFGAGRWRQEQGANPLTVAKAYQQFQNDGLSKCSAGSACNGGEGAAENSRGRVSAKRPFCTRNGPKSAAGCSAWSALKKR